MAQDPVLFLFTDYACPWCYLGRARLKKVKARPLAVRTIHFPLSPDTPAEGRQIRPYLKSRGMDVDAAMARLKALMDIEGLAWSVDPEKMAWNTRRAQELAAWAEPLVGEAVHDALFHAYQVDGKNISDVEVLAAIAVELGLDAAEARAVLTEGRMKARIDQDWTHARQVGVTSVPTYVVGQKGVVGAQSIEVLERLVASA